LSTIRGNRSLEASKRIDFGPYGAWRPPTRIYLNVERTYREFRNDPEDKPRDSARSFDPIYIVAKSRRIQVEC